MSRQSIWASKVAALVQSGNSQAALAQIKVAPSVKDVKQLRDLLLKKQTSRSQPECRQRDVRSNCGAFSASTAPIPIKKGLRQAFFLANFEFTLQLLFCASFWLCVF